MERESEIARKINPSDHLANERTFLAWIRTSVAIMAFGFVVVKFALFIKQLSYVVDTELVLPSKGYSLIIGILLVVIGGIVALLAYFRYRNIERQLINNIYFPSIFLSILLTLSVVIISIFFSSVPASGFLRPTVN